MAIFRNKHYGNFTQIDNAVIRNGELSRRARGLLAEMLSYPKDWKFTIAFLASTGKEKRGAIRTMLDELIAFGHVICETFRNEKGRFDSRYTVCETPCKDNSTSTTQSAEKNADKKSRCGQSTSDEPMRKNRHGIPLLYKKGFTKKCLQKEKEKTASENKQKFGKYENVLLTLEEYNKLIELYGKEQTDKSIESMSKYMASHKTKYDIFERLKQWIEEDIEKAKQNSNQNNNQKQQKNRFKHNDEDFDVDKYKIFVNDFTVI